MSIAAQCPNCGAPIAFHVNSSVVTVCESCSTVVARTDRSFEDLGKTSDLVQTRSPLSLWLGGTFEGVGFQLTGRAQLQHGAGGVWDEWYMAFDDGRWGWLAEAQGRFYLTFRHHGPANASDQIRPGVTVTVGDPAVAMTVAEAGEAGIIAGRGEIPYRLESGKRYFYADLSGPSGAFGTIDFSEQPPAVFIGRQVELRELNLQGGGGQDEFDYADAASQISTQAVSCDNCGGSLELHAPDQTQRVACPYCGSMHDCDRGVLRFLHTVDGGRIQPSIPLGCTATFEYQEFTLVGFMVRETSSGWETFSWEEFLFYNPSAGFRWLAQSDGHFNYLKPVTLGDIRARLPDDSHYAGERAEYVDKSYKVFQSGEAEVKYVAGEFYWRVEAGQTTTTVDYINPPEMLSGESGTGEINWTLGTYMSQADVQKCLAAGTEISCQSASGVAPNQPFRHKAVYPIWALFLVLALGLGVWAHRRSIDKTTHSQNFKLVAQDKKKPAAKPDLSRLSPEEQVKRAMEEARKSPSGVRLPYGEPDLFFSDEFKLLGGQNVQIMAHCPQVNNSWLYAQIDLYNKDNGAVYAFDVPIEYYHGIADGERWTEGSRTSDKVLSAVPTGTYVLRIMVERQNYRQSASLLVTVRQGVVQWSSWLALLFGISFIPICVAIYHFIFERRRWSQSDFAGGDDE